MGEIEKPRKSERTTEKRYSDIGWAIFLILSGGVLLAPDLSVPEGFMWVTAGIIMLGYRSALAMRGIEASIALVFGGFAFIAIGIAEFIDIEIELFPLLLIIGGVVLLGRAMTSRDSRTD